jgi:putative Holliday junction resolvase
MRYMGLDVGDATIGVAVSDLLYMTAQGRETIRRKSFKEDVDKLVDIIVEKEVIRIIVGLPKNMNGTIGPQGEKTLAFSQKLEKKLRYSDRIKNKDIEIILWDERLTTVAAERMLIDADVSRKKRKLVIDTVAAGYILQGYLDSLSQNRENGFE